MTDVLELLYKKKYLKLEDLDNKEDLKENLFLIEKQTQDEVINLYYTNLENFDKTNSDDKLKTKENIIYIKEKIYDIGNTSYFFVLFEDWNREREVLNILLSECKNAEERKTINDVFNFMTPIYAVAQPRLHLEVDEEGINYLEYNTFNIENQPEVQAKIYNLSIAELQKLYNVTGVNLFKLNVRIGIQDKKAGRDLKKEFKNYLKVGIFNSISSQNIKDEIKDYLILSDSQIEQYRPELFWYNHNGINIYVDKDSEFDVETKHIILNPEKVSVINGAQTLTNIFLSKEELLKDLEGFTKGDSIDFEAVINKVLDDILVKTVFIEGDTDLSKSITWGLNNQIPIRTEDFISTSKVVDDLNNELEKRQMKILKTGEREDLYASFSPLDFAKVFLVVDNKPGTSKNFKKIGLETLLTSAYAKIIEDNGVIERITVALEVEKWWKQVYRETENKSLFLRYGKNYFQSYVVYILSKNQNLKHFIGTDLEIYYEDIESYLKTVEVEINDFKKDTLFDSIINKIESNTKLKDEYSIGAKETELVKYINENKQHNYSINKIIKRFNNENDISVDSFRTISLMKDNVKENFPLPNSTFEEFYKRKGYMEDEDYPVFSNSLFLKELERTYPVYVINLDEHRNVSKIHFIQNFSLTNGNKWRENAEKAFKKVKEAFIEGELKKFPKISSDICFHVRPKAINGNDTFQFTDGNDITKRTFWANASFIKDIITNMV